MNSKYFANLKALFSQGDFPHALLGFGLEDAKADEADALEAAFQKAEGRILTWSLSKAPAQKPPRSKRDKWLFAGKAATGEGYRIEIGATPEGAGKEEIWETLSSLVMQGYMSGSGNISGSVFIREESPAADLNWQWPLRVGTLATEASSAFVSAWDSDIKAYSNGGWVSKLLKRKALGEGAPECDVLALPGSVDDALAVLAANRSRYAADLVLVLAPRSGMPRGLLRWARTIFTLVRCSAVAVLNADDPFAAFRQFTEELSHGLPIDRALYASAAALHACPPFIIGSRALMLRSALRRRGLLLSTKLKDAIAVPNWELGSAPPVPKMDSGERGISTPESCFPGEDIELRLPTAAKRMGWETVDGEERVFASAVSDRLRSDVFTDVFDSERRMASALAEVEESAREAGVNTSMPRFLQARPFVGKRLGAEQPSRPLKRFRAGSSHGVDVHIGPVSTDQSLLRMESEFPVHELPQNLDEYKLDVDFAPLSVTEPTQRSTLILPRHGPSEACRFMFQVPPEATHYEARIIVSYRNRVLQTVRLGGVTTHYKGVPNSNEEVGLRAECLARGRLSALQGATRFASSFIFNDTAAGRPAVTTLNDRGVWVRTDDGLPKLAEIFDRFFSRLADKPADYMGGMTAPAKDLLRNLAIDGQLIYQHLNDQGAETVLMQDQGAVQVFTKLQNGRIPVEFVYQSEKGPNTNADICPDWEQCIEHRACKHPATREFFCPSRFWGLSRVIERHGYDALLARQLEPDFLLQAEPVENRMKLVVLNRTLLGGSQKVDAVLQGGMASVLAAASQVTSMNAQQAQNWDDWRQKAKQQADSLLMIVHTDKIDGSIAKKMEIGGDDSLHTGQVDEEIIGEGPGHHPLVLLLGCHTGTSEVPFEAITAQFKRKKAAIVLGTGCFVHVTHAVPFMKLFLHKLRDSLGQGDEVSFGEFMRRLRVDCMKQGLLLALALTAYGDADWILAQSPQSTPPIP